MREVGDRIKALDAELQARSSRRASRSRRGSRTCRTRRCRPGSGAGAEPASCAPWGEPRTFDFEPQPHWDIATAARPARLRARAPRSPAPGSCCSPGAARGSSGRSSTSCSTCTCATTATPRCRRRTSCGARALFGTGQLPKLEGDMYLIGEDDLFLNPTAEVPVTNIYRDEILEPGMLPRYLTAYCASYRREAGAAGKDTRGMVRVHQFDKVELVKIVPPETELRRAREAGARGRATCCEALELPYRVMLLCSGDMSFAAAKCYDFEVWSPGHQSLARVLVVLELRGLPGAPHGPALPPRGRGQGRSSRTRSTPRALALPRTFAALLENHQTADGGVRIPIALRPYLDGLEELRREDCPRRDGQPVDAPDVRAMAAVRPLFLGGSLLGGHASSCSPHWAISRLTREVTTTSRVPRPLLRAGVVPGHVRSRAAAASSPRLIAQHRFPIVVTDADGHPARVDAASTSIPRSCPAASIDSLAGPRRDRAGDRRPHRPRCAERSSSWTVTTSRSRSPRRRPATRLAPCTTASRSVLGLLRWVPFAVARRRAAAARHRAVGPRDHPPAEQRDHLGGDGEGDRAPARHTAVVADGLDRAAARARRRAASATRCASARQRARRDGAGDGARPRAAAR